MKPYVVLDIETTGLSKYKHAITEIAAVKFDGDCVVDEYQVLINPERHIPSNITKLTGISNDMVADAPVLSEVLGHFFEFAGDAILVAHNASFDIGFLEYHHTQQFGKTISQEVLCTRKLANRLLPDLPSKSLYSLCQYFEVENEQAHRALADARATQQIFGYFLDDLMAREYTDQDVILQLQDWPKYKV